MAKLKLLTEQEMFESKKRFNKLVEYSFVNQESDLLLDEDDVDPNNPEQKPTPGSEPNPMDVSKETSEPTDELISEKAKRLGTTYRELPYKDVALAGEYFEDLARKYKIDATPTLVILNKKTGKVTILQGGEDFSEEKILQSIY